MGGCTHDNIILIFFGEIMSDLKISLCIFHYEYYYFYNQKEIIDHFKYYKRIIVK